MINQNIRKLTASKSITCYQQLMYLYQLMNPFLSVLCKWLEEKLGWCKSNEDMEVIMVWQW